MDYTVFDTLVTIGNVCNFRFLPTLDAFGIVNTLHASQNR